MISFIYVIFFFIVVVSCCCLSDDKSSGNSTAKRNTVPRNNYNSHRNVAHQRYDYCECPSCGAPYYDGYCEECGYPDINQGWIGENY